MELEKANGIIANLKEKLKLYEGQMLPPAQPTKAQSGTDVEETKERPRANSYDVQMMAEGANETSHLSQRSKLALEKT